MDRILILGGCGYLGKYAVEQLFLSNYDVSIYDNILYEPHFLDDFDFYYGDITDYDRLESVLKEVNPDVVINLAALVGDPACKVNPDRTKQVNQDAVEWLCNNYDGKIIHISTCSVFGINNNLLDENSPTNPVSVYAETKLASEEYVLKKKDGLVFRLGTLYGSTSGRPRLDLVVNVFSVLSALGRPLKVTGKEAWRPILHVKDVTTAIKLALSKNLSGLYVLSEQNIQIGTLAEQVNQITGNPNDVIYEDLAAEDLRNYRVDSSKIQNEGFYPYFTLTHGVLEVYNMIKERRVKDPFSTIYHNGKFILELESNS